MQNINDKFDQNLVEVIIMMETKGLRYSNKEVLKMVYYFQNRSLLRIMWEWFKLNLRKKVRLSEIEKIK